MRYKVKKTPIILQASDTECGVAVLASLFQYYHFSVSIEELREECGVSRDGCKATSLLQAARKYGFHADAFKMDIDALQSLDIPVIAFWNFNHYVIINGFSKKYVYINDPGYGDMRLSLKELDNAYTGIVIAITPNKVDIKKQSLASITKLIFNIIFNFQFEILFSLCLLSLIIIATVLSAAVTRMFFNQCVIASNTVLILPISCLFCAISCSYAISMIISKSHEFWLASKFVLIKSAKLFTHLLELPILFYAQRQKSELIAIINRVDVSISILYKTSIRLMFDSIVAISCIAIMSTINYILAIISLSLSILSCSLAAYLANSNNTNEKSNIYSMGKLYAIEMNMIKNGETITASGMEGKLISRWLPLFCGRMNILSKSSISYSLSAALTITFPFLSSMMILLAGAEQIHSGKLTIGTLVAFFTLNTYVVNTMVSFINGIKEIKSAKISCKRVDDILEYKRDKRTHAQKNDFLIYKKSDHIYDFGHVSFYYNKTIKPVLDDITITVLPGQHIGIVGTTGSGKSTLGKLFAGLFYADDGIIRLFDKPIDGYTLSHIAKFISYMSQECGLFSGTLYDNLIFYRDNVSPAELENAIELCQLAPLVNSRGLYAKVDEGGANYSGGERQRIELARAILQNTPIIILDEATSALDIHTETQLITNLRKLNKTIIYIAHRLSTIQHCDQIIVMDDGRIVENGTHEQLLLKRSYYYQLCMQPTHLLAS